MSYANEATNQFTYWQNDFYLAHKRNPTAQETFEHFYSELSAAQAREAAALERIQQFDQCIRAVAEALGSPACGGVDTDTSDPYGTTAVLVGRAKELVDRVRKAENKMYHPKLDTAVSDIVREWIKANGFDGLCHGETECGCHFDDFIICQGEGAAFPECRPAYKFKRSGYEYWMSTNKNWKKSDECE